MIYVRQRHGRITLKLMQESLTDELKFTHMTFLADDI